VIGEELLKDDEDYKSFLILYEGKKNPSSYPFPRFMQKFRIYFFIKKDKK